MLNHVLLHQTIIGLEAKKQLKMAGEKLPDVVIGCAGGGSNFAGLAFPFTTDKINGAKIDIIPVEPAACPKMTRGPFVYDHGDTACMTPLLAMYSLGHTFVPAPIHAGGLRYHGMAPLVCQGIVEGLFTPKSYVQSKCYEAAMTWAKTEGTICAPETSHAIAATIDEADQGPRGRQREGHSLQLQRPRPDGPDRLRQVHVRQAHRLRAARGGPAAVHEGPREHAEGPDEKKRPLVRPAARFRPGCRDMRPGDSHAMVRRLEMKRVFFGIAGAIRRVGTPLLAVLLMAAAATAQEWEGDILQEESGALQATAGVTWDSKYIWRGFDIFDDKSVTHLMFDLNLWDTGFGVGAVGHRANSGGFEDRERWDGTAYYQGGLFDGAPLATNFRVGYVYYYYPELNDGAVARHAGGAVGPVLAERPADSGPAAQLRVDRDGTGGDPPRSLPDGGSGVIAHRHARLQLRDPGLHAGDRRADHHPALRAGLQRRCHRSRRRGLATIGTVVYPNPDHDFSNAVFGASTEFPSMRTASFCSPRPYTTRSRWNNTVNEDDSEFWVSVGLRYTF